MHCCRVSQSSIFLNNDQNTIGELQAELFSDIAPTGKGVHLNLPEPTEEGEALSLKNGKTLSLGVEAPELLLLAHKLLGLKVTLTNDA